MEVLLVVRWTFITRIVRIVEFAIRESESSLCHVDLSRTMNFLTVLTLSIRLKMWRDLNTHLSLFPFAFLAPLFNHNVPRSSGAVAEVKMVHRERTADRLYPLTNSLKRHFNRAERMCLESASPNINPSDVNVETRNNWYRREAKGTMNLYYHARGLSSCPLNEPIKRHDVALHGRGLQHGIARGLWHFHDRKQPERKRRMDTRFQPTKRIPAEVPVERCDHSMFGLRCGDRIRVSLPFSRVFFRVDRNFISS